MKVEKIGLSNDLDVECEKKETKSNSYFLFGLRSGTKGIIINIGQNDWEKTRFMRKIRS